MTHMSSKLNRLTHFFLTLSMGASLAHAQAIPVPKADLSRFIGTLHCIYEDDLCPQATQGFAQQGLLGNPGFEDLGSLPKDAESGRVPVAMGFLEATHFDLAKYTFDSPVTRQKFIVLNELSVDEVNHGLITEWKAARNEYTLVRVYPQVLELSLGEWTVASKPMALGKGFVVLLKGTGSDAGINVQDYRVVQWQPQTGFKVLNRTVNKSVTPVSEILARLNDEQPAEEVTDSSMVCNLTRGGKVLRCTKSYTRMRYSRQGVEENPIGKNEFQVDLVTTGKK
jgi:hypothetical protein